MVMTAMVTEVEVIHRHCIVVRRLRLLVCAWRGRRLRLRGGGGGGCSGQHADIRNLAVLGHAAATCLGERGGLSRGFASATTCLGERCGLGRGFACGGWGCDC
jgi:hypothetical protein